MDVIINFSEAIKIFEMHLLPTILELYGLNEYKIDLIPPHSTGVNLVCTCEKDGACAMVIRIAFSGDKNINDFLGETEFVRYLYENGGNVSNVVCSLNGNMVEEIAYNNHIFYICLFEKAKGIRFPDNGYKYREGVPIREYFYNSGKVLGKLHQLAKEYSPVHRRYAFLDKYTVDYIEKLIPESLSLVKKKIYEIFKIVNELEKNNESYGMIHSDYNDGNYCIDYETGAITVFDFDESCFSWYMLDLAQLWTNGLGWQLLRLMLINEKKLWMNISIRFSLDTVPKQIFLIL